MRPDQGARYRELGRDVLHILNEPEDLRESIQRVLALIQERTGFDAVGIRLQDGDDFPYFAQNGLSPAFLAAENSLLARTSKGGICRGADGKPRLECTCGMVLRAGQGTGDPFLTKGGSFWTNDSKPLLDLPPREDPRLKPRNRCIHEGYLSVALVPIREKERIVGLIHLNDRRPGRFTQETIELLEGIAANVGSALMRKRLEEGIRASADKYRAVFENAFDPILVIDAQTQRIESLNAAALKLYGYEEPEIAGLTVQAISADPGKSRAIILEVSGGPSDNRIAGNRHRRKDGSEFPVQISASRCVLAGRMKVIVTVHDLTRRLRDEQAAMKAAEEAALLREKDRMTRDLIANVSHELRTPLAAIRGYAETLRAGGLEDRKNRAGFVSVIEKHAERLSHLVDDLLLLSDLDSKAKPPVFAALELSGFVSGCLADLAPLIDRGTSTLTVEVPRGLKVRADDDRLTRIFSNLLDNAFKYNRRGGRVTISARAEAGQAVITVRDYGRGIPKKELPRVFERFYRSQASRRLPGSGLGLAIVKDLVELHGGRVWAESTPGKGSAFMFTLPLAGRQATI